MPLIETRGAASAQGFGEFAQSAPVYIEDVFSTYLYTGNGSTQTITNGIDLSGKGGLVWIKGRSYVGTHELVDTVRGATIALQTNSTAAQGTKSAGLTAFNSSGFSVGSNYDYNNGSNTLASWTFRKQKKFFDVVTWTGDGSNPRTISHNLGSTPGCIIVKKTSAITNWFVYHRGLTNSDLNNIFLNATNDATNLGSPGWGVTSTGFTARAAASLNDNGATYVAYLFAHDAGGFGLSGTDNVISCGSFTTDGSGNATVSLGYEPQWVMFKASSDTSNWFVRDVMRGMVVDAINGPALFANLADAEGASSYHARPNATGLTFNLIPSTTYIYIAIRRGPMKVPTSGTSVYNAIATQDVNNQINVGFVTDLVLQKQPYRDVSNVPLSGPNYVFDRLRGGTNGSPFQRLLTNSTDAETGAGGSNFYVNGLDSNTRVFLGTNTANADYAHFWCFRRAPGFFDVVCWTGTGGARTLTHNLGVAPEMMILKNRTTGGTSNYQWFTYHSGLPSPSTSNLVLNDTSASGAWSAIILTPTATTFDVNSTFGNASAQNYVAYLFATVAGVSKVGSYTGSGTTKQIDCGFTGGARFVLIKRTDSTGDWYVYDSARGIVSGNDPYLFLNSTAAEVTNTDYVDTYSAGFELSSTAPAALNANGGSFIFFAVA